MTPYYERAGITIFHGRAEDVLPTLTPVDVALVLADPPYGTRHFTTGGPRPRGRAGLRGVGPARRKPGTVTGDDGPFDPTPLLIFPRLVLFGANHYAHRLPPSGGWIVWDKREGGPSDGFSDCELAWTNLGNAARIYRQLWRGLCCRGEENAQKRLHPAQKPVALMRWIIERWTAPSDLVLDPYTGSGTVLLAAQQLGRRAIGIEIEACYCEMAARRLAQNVLPLEVPV